MISFKKFWQKHKDTFKATLKGTRQYRRMYAIAMYHVLKRKGVLDNNDLSTVDSQG